MKKQLSPQESQDLISTLKARFQKHAHRHPNMEWTAVQARLETKPEKLWALAQMEKSGGEPDVIGENAKTNEIIFCDCSPESPQGRRSLCYDREALDKRKEHKPANSAVDAAAQMGVELLGEAQYRNLQALDAFDLKTSSWIKTPDEVRALGGALFCDRRYGKVFVYHNGAESYYAARGFRALLRI